MGAFPGLKRDIAQEDFWPALKAAVQQARPTAGLTTLLAKVGERGVIPVGWITGVVHDLQGPRSLGVRIAWAPWATPRNKLETVVAFLSRARGTAIVIGVAKRSEARLYEHACRYGIGRTVGAIRGFYGPGEDALMFQSVELR